MSDAQTTIKDDHTPWPTVVAISSMATMGLNSEILVKGIFFNELVVRLNVDVATTTTDKFVVWSRCNLLKRHSICLES